MIPTPPSPQRAASQGDMGQGLVLAEQSRPQLLLQGMQSLPDGLALLHDVRGIATCVL